MSVELKNCPFCGNSAKCVKSMEDSMFRIECWSDSCSSSSLRFEDREDAVTACNKRAESEAEEEVARLRSAMTAITQYIDPTYKDAISMQSIARHSLNS